MPKSHASKVREARRDYAEAKKIYNAIGKKARGKPKNSPIYRDYRTVKKIYKQTGQRLGNLTGRRPRRGR